LKWAEKEAAVLKRSFRERPPDFTFTLRLVDGENTLDVQMADYLRSFTQRFRDFRKAAGATLEYYINIEFRHQKPHCHLTVIASLDWSVHAMKELVQAWWALSCRSRPTAVYCDRVRNPVGLANYLPKYVKDRSNVEMPPPRWRGRRCRFVWRSRGFLVQSKERLWKEQCAEWFPKSEAAASLPDGSHQPSGPTTSQMPAETPTAAFPNRRRPPAGHPRPFRRITEAPTHADRVFFFLHGIRTVQMTRGP
jgi:hypothetical protein